MIHMFLGVRSKVRYSVYAVNLDINEKKGENGMAFKTMSEYNSERGYDNYFMLRNDGDSADVIFLYRNTADVLIADAHYIKTNDYIGYVHCCGRGCPACGKGISVRSKLFVPLYNLTTERIEFWDRSTFFENQLNQDIFNRYPNPSEFVFKVTRHGKARDVNTTYEIRAIGKNTDLPYDLILNKCNTKMPDAYELVIRDIGAGELNMMLDTPAASVSGTSNTNSYSGDLPSYQVTPRAPMNANVSVSVDDLGSDLPDEDFVDPDFD